VPTVIESNGSTGLVQVGANYFLYPVGTSSGPLLRLSGAAVTAGQFGPWTPIGAEQTAGGYQVAWQFGTADQYIVWTLDSTGNFLSQGAVTSGNSLAFESLEASFQQNLNHDLATGIVTTVIESNGSTSLAQVANTYSLYQGGGSSAPSCASAAWPSRRVNLARGRRSARSRWEAATRSSGSSGPPINTLSGTSTAAAITSRRAPSCRATAWRWNRSKPLSSRTSITTWRAVSSRR